MGEKLSGGDDVNIDIRDTHPLTGTNLGGFAPFQLTIDPDFSTGDQLLATAAGIAQAAQFQ